MNIGISQRHITSSASVWPHTPQVATSPPISLTSRSSILRSIDPNLSLDARKMAVVNLEAALASWKSLDNPKISQLSTQYRSKVSSNLRVNPSRIGAMPGNLMDFMFSSDRRL